MNSPSVDIKDILEGDSSALGLTFADNLFVAEVPPAPDECVTVIDTGPYAEPSHAYVLDQPKVMVKVRGEENGYNNSWELVKAIRDTLMSQWNVTVNGTRYIGIWVLSDIMWLGYDESRRPQWSVNFRIMRTT